MINEEKLKLMTYMARAESEGRLKKSIITARAYRSDYLIKQGIAAFLMGSIVFSVVAGLYALFNLASFTNTVFTDEFMRVFEGFMVKYGVFITAFVGINVLVYNYKYSKSYAHFIRYRRLQKKLIKLELEVEEDDKAS